jgi:hypothetical protein
MMMMEIRIEGRRRVTEKIEMEFGLSEDFEFANLDLKGWMLSPTLVCCGKAKGIKSELGLVHATIILDRRKWHNHPSQR